LTPHSSHLTPHSSLLTLHTSRIALPCFAMQVNLQRVRLSMDNRRNRQSVGRARQFQLRCPHPATFNVKETAMATRKAKSSPKGLSTVTPPLVCAGAADAIEFYKKAFGATEETRMPGPDGKIMHAMIRIGASPVMLADEIPAWGSVGPKSLHG